jgi:hypothetical protein
MQYTQLGNSGLTVSRLRVLRRQGRTRATGRRGQRPGAVWRPDRAALL